MTLEQKVKYFKRSIAHDKGAISWLEKINRNLGRNLQKVNKVNGIVIRVVRYRLNWHKSALRWHISLLSHYQRKWDILHPPLPKHYADWLCIHKYEGSWTDGGAPYYGGLQMDYGFMSTYGSQLLRTKGTANNWTPLEQMGVAEKAYESGRGFYPWPNTARYCGLI